MKPELLNILHCPHCTSRVCLEPLEQDLREIRTGYIQCIGTQRHRFEIANGILRLEAGFDNNLVRKEIQYEDSTYHGSPRLCDPALIAQFPDTLAELWPHTRHFGADFRDLIQRVGVRPGHWVLDIGTGPCWSSRLLAQQGARVIALDINDSPYYGLGTADLLFAHHHIYFERILESMTHLPFASESIDRITFNASFHHTPDLCRTLRECHRVLKTNGITAMVNEEFGSLRQRFFRHTDTNDGGSHHRIDYTLFNREARNAGFRIQHLLAKHVRAHFITEFPQPIANLTITFFEKAPFALQQLNSALILLTKGEVEGAAKQKNALALLQPCIT